MFRIELFKLEQLEGEQFIIKLFNIKQNQLAEGRFVLKLPEVSKKQRIGVEVRSLANMLQRNMEHHVRQSGLDEMTVMHSWVIVFLYRNEGRDIFQKDLETEFGIRRSTVTNVLQIMEKKGYIRRESVEHDSRLKRLVLLDKGKNFYQVMDRMLNEMSEQTLAGIDDAELDIFYGVIDKLKENINRQQEVTND